MAIVVHRPDPEQAFGGHPTIVEPGPGVDLAGCAGQKLARSSASGEEEIEVAGQDVAPVRGKGLRAQIGARLRPGFRCAGAGIERVKCRPLDVDPVEPLLRVVPQRRLAETRVRALHARDGEVRAAGGAGAWSGDGARHDEGTPGGRISLRWAAIRKGAFAPP